MSWYAVQRCFFFFASYGCEISCKWEWRKKNNITRVTQMVNSGVRVWAQLLTAWPTSLTASVFTLKTPHMEKPLQSRQSRMGGYFVARFLCLQSPCVPTCSVASVQFSSVAQSCPTLCDPTNRSTPGLPVHHQLPEFTQTHVRRVSDAIQPSHPLSPLLLLPPIPPSIRVFSNESTLRMRRPKYWSFSFSINPSKEHQPYYKLHTWGI